MIIVTGRVTLKDGALEKLRPAMKAMMKTCREEPGCLDYSYGPDLGDPNAFLVLEKWESWEALDAHLERPHLKAWRAALNNVGLVSRELIAADDNDMRSV